MMRSGKNRIVTTFDWFVVVVVLGYLVVVAQAVMRGGTPSLPYTPSSQLWYDSVLPPTEQPEGTSVSLAGENSGATSL